MSSVGVGSFAQFLASFDQDPHVRGKQFEKAVKWLLLNDPKHKRKYKNVWLWDEFPDRTGPDIGIDVVAQGHDNSLCAIQAKCFDSGRDIPKSEIDSFISAASPRKYAHRMLVATTDGLSANARKTLTENHVEWFLKSSLESLESFWPETISSLGAPRTISKYVPRTHQAQAINDVCMGLKSVSRGQLIMACGTGKTLTALWITERLNSSCTLVLVPSLSLLSQTLSEWTTHANQDWDYICVCSDETVNKSDDSIVTSVNEIPAVTTKPADIAKFLKTRGRKIVFSTYQSSAQVAKAQKLVGKKFDLTIADEAHRLTGKNDAEFATVLDAKKIPTKKLLFMTATPRTYTASIKQTASDRGVEISSMDDEKVFGKELHKLSFGQAIEQDLLTDYRVVIVGVTDPQVQELIERRELVSVGGKVETDARTLAAHIGLAKAVKDYDLKKTISFHGRIKTARAFAQDFPKIVEWMPDDHKPSGTLWADTITGAMNSSERRILLDKLKADIPNQHSLLSNARCLTEGIDVPALDAVAFIDPRSSQVDIIQAVGRAIRRSSNKTLGTIVLPVLIPSDVDAETAVEDTAFKPIWGIINALRAHDENLANALDELRTNLGREKSIQDEMPKKIILDMPLQIDLLPFDFASNLKLQLLERTTESWNFGFGRLRDYVSEFKQLPTRSVIYANFNLGEWVKGRRTDYNAGRLSKERIQKLESILGWTWDPFGDAWDKTFRRLAIIAGESSKGLPNTFSDRYLSGWITSQRKLYAAKELTKEKIAKLEKLEGWQWSKEEIKNDQWMEMYSHLKDFVRQNGHARVRDKSAFNGTKLGTWVSVQRRRYATKTITNEQSALLEKLHKWSWNPIEDDWNDSYREFLSFVEKNNGRTPRAHIPSESDLAQWVGVQRSAFKAKKMLPERMMKLNEIKHWSWDPVDDIWLKNYDDLRSFVREHDRLPKREKPSEKALAGWVTVQRTRNKKGTVSKKQFKLLQEIANWSWDPFADLWDSSLLALKAFAKREGHAKAPQGHIENGVDLGSFVNGRRTEYKKGKLSKERIKQLEALPGWSWTPKQDEWEQKFAQLQKYVRSFGNAKVPDQYKVDGIQLGKWVGKQRQKHKAGNLLPELVARLESLNGWTWKA